MTEIPLAEFTGNKIVGQKLIVFAVIFILAVILRISAVIYFPAKQVADPADYHRLATNLAVDHRYIAPDGSPTAWRPPGYPFFLAGIYSVAGENIFIACLIQAILGGLTVLAVMYLAMAVLDEKVAMVSGVIAALYPGLIYLPRLLLSENLAISLLLLSVLAAVGVVRSGGLKLQVLLGALLGLSALVRGANLITAALLIGLVLFVKWRAEGFAKAFRSVLPVTLAVVFTLAPWVIRNYMVFHRLAPLATQDGIGLYASYWPPRAGSKLIWGNLPGEEDPAVAAAFKTGDEMAVSEYLKRETINRLKAGPLYFFRLWPSKLTSLLAPFDWETFPHPPGAARSFNWGYVLILLPAALGALIIVRNPIPQKWALLALPAAALIQTLIFYGSPRFRLTAEPIIIILAAAGISRLNQTIKPTKIGTPMLCGLI
ncbi:MAG: glycosyltransferase family 39 protein [Nitrososphaerales archaeon]